MPYQVMDRSCPRSPCIGCQADLRGSRAARHAPARRSHMLSGGSGCPGCVITAAAPVYSSPKPFRSHAWREVPRTGAEDASSCSAGVGAFPIAALSSLRRGLARLSSRNALLKNWAYHPVQSPLSRSKLPDDPPVGAANIRRPIRARRGCDAGIIAAPIAPTPAASASSCSGKDRIGNGGCARLRGRSWRNQPTLTESQPWRQATPRGR